MNVFRTVRGYADAGAAGVMIEDQKWPKKCGHTKGKEVVDLNEAKSRTGKGKPVCILLHTEMGNGVDFMMGSHKWHGVAPNDEELANALSQNEETLGDY